ncbi:MAG: hypothetical protein RL220_1166 [Bacteroidota bacterium]
MSSKITWTRAQTIAQNYQNNGPYLDAAPDANGKPQHLKAWWIDRTSLMDILTNTPNCDGIRAYIVLQDQDEQGRPLPVPYHSLVLAGTQSDASGQHQNFRPADDLVYDCYKPCPNMCGTQNLIV